MDKIEFLDQNILDRLYEPTSTSDQTLTFEDFLKLPVNDEYLKNKNKSNTIDIITTPAQTTSTPTKTNIITKYDELLSEK
jgi:hypothetical protein